MNGGNSLNPNETKDIWANKYETSLLPWESAERDHFHNYCVNFCPVISDVTVMVGHFTR